MQAKNLSGNITRRYGPVTAQRTPVYLPGHSLGQYLSGK